MPMSSQYAATSEPVPRAIQRIQFVARSLLSLALAIAASSPGTAPDSYGANSPMRTIAKGFVFGEPTAAKRDPIARLKRLPIGSLDRDIASYPQRALDGAIRRGFCCHGNLPGQIGLDIGLPFFDGIGERTGWTAFDHCYHLGPHLDVSGVGNHFFDVSNPIPAKARFHAQGIIALDDDPGAARIDHLALRRRPGIGRFRAVEANFGMRPIAKRFVAGLPTAAESVRCPRFNYLPLSPGKRLAVLGDDLCLAHQWNITVNDVRAISLYHNPLVPGIAFFVPCHGFSALS
jgi:hypothetical protein